MKQKSVNWEGYLVGRKQHEFCDNVLLLVYFFAVCLEAGFCPGLFNAIK